MPGVDIEYAQGTDLQAAAAAGAATDAAVVVVVGYTAEDEGEYVGSFDPELAVLYPRTSTGCSPRRRAGELAAAATARPD